MSVIGLAACGKPPVSDPVVPPVDTIPAITDTTAVLDFKVDNTWQCDIDGVTYSGTIDTSFIQVLDTVYNHGDTVVTFTGTAYNKKANIILTFNTRSNSSAQTPVGYIAFDTASLTLLSTANSGNPNNITCPIDSIRPDKIKGRFSGILYSLSPIVKHTVTNGIFSCKYFQGNNEPKKFYWDMYLKPVPGYFNSAVIVSNTLILDGQPYGYPISDDKVQLQIRTGEDVKPGVYKSINGDVGMYYYTPNINRQYVDDSMGDLTVTILSAENGVVKGIFSGSSRETDTIMGGTFSCRIKNYQPVSDSVNQWKFNTKYDWDVYRMYGGNILKAQLLQQGGKYILAIDGNSDYGASKFKLQLSSPVPIATGVYSYPGAMLSNRYIDSFYFKSNEQIINKGDVYIPNGNASRTIITIDKIDAFGVSGTISGGTLGAPEPGLKTGSFTATF